MNTHFFAYLLILVWLLYCAQALNITQCGIDVKAAYSRDPTSVSLRSSNGRPVSQISDAWGVSYADCKGYCGRGHKPFDWNDFAGGISSWVLPWLALTAQLPYETRSGYGNFEAFYLAVGSPVLIIYSLCMSALNVRWINEQFRHTRERVEQLSPDFLEENDREQLLKTLDCAREVVASTQHNPVSFVLDSNGQEFVKIFEDPETRKIWWQVARAELKKTQRKWQVTNLRSTFDGCLLSLRTYSLQGQIAFVIITQILAIILFFTSAAKNSTIGSGLAINGMWIWLVPIVIGFVKVGIQSRAGAVDDAFKAAHESLPTPPHRNPMIGTRTVDRQSARRFHRSYQDVSGNVQAFKFGMLVQGDEYNPGPVYNYARVWSHVRFAELVVDNFDQLVQSFRNHLPDQTSNSGDDIQPPNVRVVGSPLNRMEMDHTCLLYPQRNSHSVTMNMIISGLVALLTQVLTTGSAAYTAYQYVQRTCRQKALTHVRYLTDLFLKRTPVVGLGCQSGPYALYGLVAILIFSLLLSSAYCSLCFSRHLESSAKPRSQLATVAVLARFLGKALAFWNAIYVILISALQFTNATVSCICMSCVWGLRQRAWVILFASRAQTVALARESWIVGVFTNIGAAVVLTLFVFVGRGEEIYQTTIQ